MAQLSHYSFFWQGSNFSPGTEKTWWIIGASFQQVVSVTAHSIGGATGYYRSLMVKEVHAFITENGVRGLQIVLRNTGTNYITGYSLNVAYVTP